ncbi:MAG: MerR family transcriptional regulator [Firmicutes bacterium]|nr:MerR family transcriptional regulator [Bacillota bacterium]
MKNIKEAEQLTGISSQNIRYYEKQGLICPARNEDNSYREYSDNDIERLKLIRLFRKLGMPIEELRRLLNGEVDLRSAVEMQEKRLESQRNELNNALDFCKKIHEAQLADFGVNRYLQQMEEDERSGSVFMQFINDYKEIVRSEAVREFSFMPDTRCDTPDEFEEALLKYAAENKARISFSRKGMSPDFFMDGIEYHAYRTSGRYGIVVHCEMKHPEDYIPKGMSSKKYRLYRILSVAALPLLLFLISNLYLFRELDFGEPFTWLMILFIGVLFVSDLSFIYYCYGKNFRG